MKIPRYIPHLSVTQDSMDDYYELDKIVTEFDFATWWAVVFKRGKIKNLKDVRNFPKYKLNYICRTESNYDGNWCEDLFGGMFNVMGLYPFSYHHLEYLPKPIFGKYWLNTEHTESTAQQRFDFILGLIDKYYGQENK